MPPIVHSDIWQIIIQLLKQPIPLPGSYPPRSTLRQPDLCSAARVCRLFSDIVNPILYKEVCTDDLAALFANPTSPSMIRRFAMTKRLYIELGPKGEETSYRALLGRGASVHGRWSGVGRHGDELEKAILEDAEKEILNIYRAVRRVLGPAEGRLIVLPRVESVAIATFNGAEPEMWGQYKKTRTIQGVPNIFDKLTEAFDHLLSRLPSLRHICTRDFQAPLTLGTMPGHTYHPFVRTIHFRNEVGWLQTDPGVPIRLVCELSPNEDSSQLMELLEARLSGLIDHRVTPSMRAAFGSKVVDAEMYCSSSSLPLSQSYFLDRLGGSAHSMTSLEAQRVITAELGKMIQKGYRQASGLQDKFRWYASADTPTCQACGSGAPV